MTVMCFATTAVVDFTGKDLNGTNCKLDKVLVENLTQGWQETITDVSMSIEVIDQETALSDVSADKEFTVIGNSFEGKVQVVFNLPQAGQVFVFIYDVAGRCICQSVTEQEAGFHSVNIAFSTPQIYYLHINTPNKEFSHSILNLHAGNNMNIQYSTHVKGMPALTPLAHSCEYGDEMRYTGYTTYKNVEHTNIQQAKIKELESAIEFEFDFYKDWYIKHPWGTREDEDWSWKQMSKEAEGYVFCDFWGGVGANINTINDDADAEWFPLEEIEGSSELSIGDAVKFVYNPTEGTLSVSEMQYYIKHPWGYGDDEAWEWVLMTKEDGYYVHKAHWGGVGANINTIDSEEGALWFAEDEIVGASEMSNGDGVKFIYDPLTNTLSVESNTAHVRFRKTNENTYITGMEIRQYTGDSCGVFIPVAGYEFGEWKGTSPYFEIPAQRSGLGYYVEGDVSICYLTSEDDFSSGIEILDAIEKGKNYTFTCIGDESDYTFSVSVDDNYYIKHSWGSGDDEDWSWELLTKDGDNYVFEGLWGGFGANINTSAEDAYAEFFSIDNIDGASTLSIGDAVKFTYSPLDGTLSVEKLNYFIKHAWGTGEDEDWSWQPMKQVGYNFLYDGIWGGVGANINTIDSDDDEMWFFGLDEIEGSSSVDIGDKVQFVYNLSSKTLSVSKIGKAYVRFHYVGDLDNIGLGLFSMSIDEIVCKKYFSVSSISEFFEVNLHADETFSLWMDWGNMSSIQSSVYNETLVDGHLYTIYVEENEIIRDDTDNGGAIYIKHPWGTGDDGDWSWEQLTSNGNKYEFIGQWGGVGADINSIDTDVYGRIFIPESEILGASSLSLGDKVQFSYDAENGTLSAYMVYYIKHPWGTGEDKDWSWQQMTREGENYIYEGLWGGVGVNINKVKSEGTSLWFSADEIEGASSLTIGEAVLFIYNPEAGTLAATNKAQVRFCKEKDYLYVTEMAIRQVPGGGTGLFDEVASYEFGTDEGISPYYEIPAQESFPDYYYNDGEISGYYFAFGDENPEYTFELGRRYTYSCGDDGLYFVFTITVDGLFNAQANSSVLVRKRILKSEIQKKVLRK